MMHRRMTLAAMVAMLATAAPAQDLTGAEVEPLLYPATGSAVEIVPQPFLPADQAQMLQTVGAAQAYYGAIAVSPDEGMMVEATVAAANHHSTEAASIAALAGCDAKRKGAAPCVIVALIRPAGWQARAFQLSSGATAGFLDNYAGTRRARAFAISPATGHWGMGKGGDAAAKAVKDCVAKAAGAPVGDCAVVVAD